MDALADIEATLDQLIRNARVLNRAEDGDLEQQQERLFNHLLSMNADLDAEDKVAGFKESRELYSSLREKIFRFSLLNSRLVRSPKEPIAKRTRVPKSRRQYQ
jgi:hypothetical protein